MLAGGLEIWTGSIMYGWSITFFILAGLLMSSGGIARRLVNLALLVLGKVPGSPGRGAGL
jgi:TRAP-type C4-dicarboxylate transport system permease large subunit